MLIFWTSYLWVPFAISMLVLLLKRKGMLRLLAGGLLVLSLPLAWARFVEPHLLFVKHTAIDLSDDAEPGAPVRLALMADMHVGLFGNTMPLQRIVDRINREKVDAVLIAGDIIYHPKRSELSALLAPLAELEAPVYAVLGNHDVGFPGPDFEASLYLELTKLGVTLVENRAYETVLGDQPITISGTSDLWQRKQSYQFATDLAEDKPVLVLTHNPDTAYSAPLTFHYDLMLAGHTHGGQIRIPGLVQAVIPTRYPFDTGLHKISGRGDVFVTPGTGMVGLPMRFMRPPRIDVLELRFATKRASIQ